MKVVNGTLPRIGIALVICVSFFQFISLGSGIKKLLLSNIEPEEIASPVKASLVYKYLSCSSQGEVPLDEFKEEFVPEKIVIPSTNIDLAVVSEKLSQGTWKVNAGVANYAVETSTINSHGGNVGIYAHDRVGEFTSIKELKEGDSIEIYGDRHLAKYKVKSSQVLTPQDIEVFYPTKEPTLTLITCDGTFSQKRYAVTAELVEIHELDCNE